MIVHPQPPCGRDCERRHAGCAANCPNWAEYVKARSAYYKKLHALKKKAVDEREKAHMRYGLRVKEGFEG